MRDGYSEVLERAMAWARENLPNASAQRHAAFANSVAYAVTGASGGYGGPSVREHAAARVARPKMSYEKAVATLGAAGGVIFGPLTDLHREAWEHEHCFDDDPEDMASLA